MGVVEELCHEDVRVTLRCCRGSVRCQVWIRRRRKESAADLVLLENVLVEAWLAPGSRKSGA